MVFQKSAGFCIYAGFQTTKIDIITKSAFRIYTLSVCTSGHLVQTLVNGSFYLSSKKIFNSSSNFFVGLF